MSSFTTKFHLKTFHELLQVVDYPELQSYNDEESFTKLFRNIEEKDKQDLFTWIVTQFDESLTSYAIAHDKLRHLLFATGLIDSEFECADFLTGLLTSEEQLYIWKKIFMVVYYHKKEGCVSSEETAVVKDSSSNTESVTCRLKNCNLLPPEYQEEFEEKTKGNYKEYIETMKKKLFHSQEKKSSSSDNSRVDRGNSLEEVVEKVLKFKVSPRAASSDISLLDLESLSEFSSNYEQYVKPYIGQALDGVDNESKVHKLNCFGDFLREYSFLAQGVESLKGFANNRDLLEKIGTLIPE